MTFELKLLDKIALIESRVGKLARKANKFLDIDPFKLNVLYTLRGQRIGIAGRNSDGLFINLNSFVLNSDSWKVLLDEVLPHEYAHIVCMIRPSLGYMHDEGWKRICVFLGGNGQRVASDIEFRYTVGKTYRYSTDEGEKVLVSERRHNRIQEGKIFLKVGNRMINKMNRFEVA